MRLIDADKLEYEIDTQCVTYGNTDIIYKSEVLYRLKKSPTVDAELVKHGKWIEKHYAYSDEESVIEEWQSCKCSECGRYDTRPYLYYFAKPKFCSWCGARMDGDAKNG